MQENQVRNDVIISPSNLQFREESDKNSETKSSTCKCLASTLVKVFLQNSAGSRKVAFTLAEVLITLGIIGVVAAMTLPSLINNYQKKQFITQMIKVYSELNQAVKFSELEYGSMEDWNFDITGKDFFETYFANYIKLDKQKLSDVKSKNNITYYQISGNPETGLRVMGADNDPVVFTLASGTQVFVDEFFEIIRNNKRLVVVVDVNGYKKPNTFGKDVWAFRVDSTQNGVTPFATDDNEIYSTTVTREKLKDGPSIFNYQCNKNGRGMWCSALILMYDGKVEKDYPW